MSGMLFVLGIEILALAIIQNSKIKGITVGSHEIKITQYAHDTTVFLRKPTIYECIVGACRKL